MSFSIDPSLLGGPQNGTTPAAAGTPSGTPNPTPSSSAQPTLTQASGMTTTQGGQTPGPAPGPSLSRGGPESMMSAQEQEMHQKDQELAQFLLRTTTSSYQPLIPDAVISHYLSKAGCDVTDIRVQRLLGLACQKFISDIAGDAFSYARTRTGQAPGGRSGAVGGAPGAAGGAGAAGTGPTGAAAGRDRARTTLTQEDLSQALAEYGINASRAPYYL